jgi:hypothetical protein
MSINAAMLSKGCRFAGLMAGVLFCTTAAATAPHPRLMLNPERIAALKAEITTTRHELWPPAFENAQEFSRETIPAMRDANNRYRRFGDTMPALGLAYHMTGDRQYVAAADRWLKGMLAVPEWRGSENLGRSAWVTGAALLYDWLHDVLPSETRARVRDRLVAEGEILLRETSYWRLLSNHCLIETAALGLIGLTLQGEHERAPALLEIARERAELIIEHAPLDGSWGEGVQYWQYGLGYFLRFLEASRTAGDRDYFPRYEWLKQTGLFPIHFSVPGNPIETVNIGDSGMNDYVASFLMYLPASVYRNGYSQDYGNKTRSTKPYKFSWLDFILYDPGVAPLDFTTQPRFHHFADNGFVMMRSGWDAGSSLLAFHCGPGPGHRNQADPRRLERRGFGPGHAHPDINGFSFFAHGQWLVLDPGYVREKWTRDENTILVNGHGQAGEGGVWLDYMAFQNRVPAPRILRAETHPKFDYVIGDAGNVYVDEAGVGHFRRHLLFLKPDIVVVLDDIATTRPSRIEWLLQARDAARETEPGRFEIAASGTRLWVRPILPAWIEAKIHTREIRAASTAGRLTTLNIAAQTEARATFLVVHCALPDATAAPPVVDFKDGQIGIRHLGMTWRVQVDDPATTSDPARPLLTLKR